VSRDDLVDKELEEVPSESLTVLEELPPWLHLIWLGEPPTTPPPRTGEYEVVWDAVHARVLGATLDLILPGLGSARWVSATLQPLAS
jgi:hypothetical protein